MKTHNGIAKVATAAAVLLMASCSMPVQVPVQTQQQQQNTQSLVEQLRKLVQGPSQANKTYPWEEVVAAPQPLPQVVWPARGAGDFPQTLPPVVWPAPGAGDFETAQAQPQWLVGPVKDSQLPVAGINPNLVIPELLSTVIWPETAALRPALIQKAGEDLLDRHPVNVAPPAPRAVPAGIRPESLEPAGKTDLIRVPGPVDDCPIRPAAGPC
jgi:hypothetical protein